MLSKRLNAIKNLVDKDKVIYDVGTDHALLPCFLVKENIAKKVYAVDNKEGPLLKAKENINKFGLDGKVIPILSNGIDDIKNDVNIITICGMGYFTLIDILKDKDLSKYEKIIVQINKDTNLFRQYLSDNEYTIIDEEIVFDDFYYEIIVFNAKKDKKLNHLEIEYGPKNLEKRSEIFIDYLNDRKNKLIIVNESAHKQEYTKIIKEIDDIINTIM